MDKELEKIIRMIYDHKHNGLDGTKHLFVSAFTSASLPGTSSATTLAGTMSIVER